MGMRSSSLDCRVRLRNIARSAPVCRQNVLWRKPLEVHFAPLVLNDRQTGAQMDVASVLQIELVSMSWGLAARGSRSPGVGYPTHPPSRVVLCAAVPRHTAALCILFNGYSVQMAPNANRSSDDGPSRRKSTSVRSLSKATDHSLCVSLRKADAKTVAQRDYLPGLQCNRNNPRKGWDGDGDKGFSRTVLLLQPKCRVYSSKRQLP